MNCQECRKHLYPYLDDELEISENLAILEHLNACQDCRDLFTAEEMSWKAIRERLQMEALPEGFTHRLNTAICREDRQRNRSRALAFTLAAAALIMVVFVLRELPLFGSGPQGGGRPGQEAGQQGPERHIKLLRDEHGPGIDACVRSFEQLLEDANQRGRDVLSSDSLAEHRFRLAPESDRSHLLDWILQPGRSIPASELKTNTCVAYRNLKLLGGTVKNVIFDLDGQAIAIYQMTRKLAHMVGLDPIPGTGSKKLHMARCNRCRVVTVVKGSIVWIMVTASRVQPVADFASRVF